jgi:hypothetical protein
VALFAIQFSRTAIPLYLLIAIAAGVHGPPDQWLS